MSESWAGEYLQMCTDCEKRESRLSEWERGFISSISDQLGREKPLSVRQTETLNNIWEKATANG